MSKSKKDGYRCKSCGFEGTKSQLIAHCEKEHKHEPEILFDMIGEFGSLEAATIAYKKLLMDTRTYNTLVSDLKSSNKLKQDEIVRLSKGIETFNETFNLISHTLALASKAIQPIQQPSENGS